MRLVTITSLIAFFGTFASPMLIQSALAVEVPETNVQESLPSVQRPSKGCFILGSQSFSIPFTVDQAGAQPVAVRLFVSRGPGNEWKLTDQIKPNAVSKQFQFQAEDDGEYWFATRTIDAAGQAHPSGEITPQLKVFVDTTKPAIALEAEADDQGRIYAALNMDDATPLKLIQLRYATDMLKSWQAVEVSQKSSSGKIQFDPKQGWKLLSLQLVVSDAAGNQTVINQMVRRPRVANGNTKRFASKPTSESTAAKSLPYRMDGESGVSAETVSGPGEPPMLAPLPNGTTPSINPPPATSAWSQSRSAANARNGQGVHGSRFERGNLYGAAPQANNAAVEMNSRYRGARPSAAGSQAAARSQMMTRSPNPAGIPPNSAGVPRSQVNPEMQGRQAVPPNSVPSDGTVINPRSGMGFAPPSVRGTPPAVARSERVASALPPPASPMEIGEGFGLNSPQGSLPRPAAQDGTPIPAGVAESKSASEPRTVAEAMRPITEQSAVTKLQQEQIPAPNPQAEPERYRSERVSAPESKSAMQRAPVRFSDSERFSLEYELEAVGSQGVEAIELYGSLDHGSTWSLWGQDPDRSSPFDIETKGEGVFGFRIVVVGGNGLASPRPLAGESPDIFVVVDRTRPGIRITGARYGEGDRTGGLVIRYECNDTNLPRRPVGLAFSGSPDGPWTTIAAGLENTGEYVWRADPNLPRQLYLRIDGTDQAGNVGTYILDQPIDTQGLAPRARIRGFQPLSGNPPANAGQTALRNNGSLK
ncbi:hypothetical protein N9B88_00100 [Rubripirellula sp.]|nr:hypothetical protein [Rubripirellula sp.]